MEETIYFSLEQIQTLKETVKDRKFKVSFYCEICGVLYSKCLYAKNFQLKCRKCLTKETNQKLYGVDNVSQLDNVKAKKQITSQKHYGVSNPLQSIEIQRQIKETCLIKYGTDNPSKSQEVKDKAKQTCISRYGSVSPTQNSLVIEKVKQTCINKYGTAYPIQLDFIKEKMRKTCLERYGNESYTGLGNYIYQNISFDSSWELAFYIYCIDHNISIIREPCYFTYLYQNITYRYYPDFQIPCGIVEIKGEQFFDKDGNFINPFNVSQNGLYEAKYNCMLKHNVNIFRGEQIKFFLSYIKNKYGSEYLKQFKWTKNNDSDTQ